MSEEEQNQQQQNSGQGSIQISGDGNLVLQLDSTLTRLAESQMQAAFYRATGIYCSKDARIKLEELLDAHGFTVREINRAWTANSIAWDRKSHQIYNVSRIFDLTFGWGGVALSTVIFMVLMLMFLGNGAALRSPNITMIICGLTMGFTGVVLVFTYTLLYPQKVASRVDRALSKPLTAQDGAHV